MMFTAEDDAVFRAAWEVVVARNALQWGCGMTPERRPAAEAEMRRSLDELKNIARECKA